MRAKWPRWFVPNCNSKRRLAIRRHHDARVANEDVEPGEGPCIAGSAHSHVVEIGKVKRQRVEFGLRNFRSDTRDSRKKGSRFPFIWVAEALSRVIPDSNRRMILSIRHGQVQDWNRGATPSDG